MVSISQKLQWQGSNNSIQLCPGIWWMESSWAWHFKCFREGLGHWKCFLKVAMGQLCFFAFRNSIWKILPKAKFDAKSFIDFSILRPILDYLLISYVYFLLKTRHSKKIQLAKQKRKPIVLTNLFLEKKFLRSQNCSKFNFPAVCLTIYLFDIFLKIFYKNLSV